MTAFCPTCGHSDHQRVLCPDPWHAKERPAPSFDEKHVSQGMREMAANLAFQALALGGPRGIVALCVASAAVILEMDALAGRTDGRDLFVKQLDENIAMLKARETKS